MSTRLNAAWMRLPLPARKLIVDFAETFAGNVILLNFFIPGTLDETKALTLLVAGAASSAAISAVRRAAPGVIVWLRTTFPAVILRVLLALSLVVVALGVTPTAAFAATQGSCSTGDATRALFYENAIGDTAHGDDRLWQCSNRSSFADVLTLPSSWCYPNTADFTWNNCISSVAFSIPGNYWFCIYTGANYSGSHIMEFYNPPSGTAGWVQRRNFTLGNDLASSFRWVSAATGFDC